MDSAGLMASSLSILFNNLCAEINKRKCKYGCDDKNCETCGIKLNIATVFLNTQTLKMI